MLVTCYIGEVRRMEKKYHFDYKYFIVINPKEVHLKGFSHRPDLGPSRELYKWFLENKHKKDWFVNYKRKFIVDMEDRPGLKRAVAELKEKSKRGNVLAVCFCENVNACHRGIIADDCIKDGIEVIKH